MTCIRSAVQRKTRGNERIRIRQTYSENLNAQLSRTTKINDFGPCPLKKRCYMFHVQKTELFYHRKVVEIMLRKSLELREGYVVHIGLVLSFEFFLKFASRLLPGGGFVWVSRTLNIRLQTLFSDVLGSS